MYNLLSRCWRFWSLDSFVDSLGSIWHRFLSTWKTAFCTLKVYISWSFVVFSSEKFFLPCFLGVFPLDVESLIEENFLSMLWFLFKSAIIMCCPSVWHGVFSPPHCFKISLNCFVICLECFVFILSWKCKSKLMSFTNFGKVLPLFF